MRVLFWSEQFWPQIGGIEVWSAKLLAALQQRGHQFTVIAAHHDPASASDNMYQGMAVHRYPFWPALMQRDLAQLTKIKSAVAELKKTFRPHLIHLNLSGPSIYFHLQTANSHPAPLLVSLHQPLDHQSGRPNSVTSRILQEADWVTAGSEIVLSTGRKVVPTVADRSSVIPFGCETPVLPPAPLPLDEPHLLCLGRLVFEKGLDLVLTALSTIKNRFPKLHLTIASDGPARPALEKQTAALNLSNSVDFIGWVEAEKLPALFNSATMVLMPSRVIEGFGLVAMEAAMMGRPVVATRSGGLGEVIIDGKTGLLVERDNSEALAHAIAYLLDYPRVAIRMGQAAQTRAQALFSWSRHLDAFALLYRQFDNGYLLSRD